LISKGKTVPLILNSSYINKRLLIGPAEIGENFDNAIEEQATTKAAPHPSQRFERTAPVKGASRR
jgi:hypothetical protein